MPLLFNLLADSSFSPPSSRFPPTCSLILPTFWTSLPLPLGWANLGMHRYWMDSMQVTVPHQTIVWDKTSYAWFFDTWNLAATNITQQRIGNCHGNSTQNLFGTCIHSWHDRHRTRRRSATTLRREHHCSAKSLKSRERSARRERLRKMILPDLRVIYRNKRLPVSGTEPVLIERIIVGGSGVGEQNNGDVGQQQEVPTVLTVLMKSWIKAPFKSNACREGTLNKPFIFSHFPKFVLQKSAERPPSGNRRRLKIESLHEFGLLCHPTRTKPPFHRMR